MKVAFLLPVLALFTVAALADAASPPEPKDYNISNAQSYNAHFGDMDADADGKVSWTEFKAFFPKADHSAFAAIDRSRDGGLDHDEWHDFKAAYGLKHKD